MKTFARLLSSSAIFAGLVIGANAQDGHTDKNEGRSHDSHSSVSRASHSNSGGATRSYSWSNSSGRSSSAYTPRSYRSQDRNPSVDSNNGGNRSYERSYSRTYSAPTYERNNSDNSSPWTSAKTTYRRQDTAEPEHTYTKRPATQDRPTWNQDSGSRTNTYDRGNQGKWNSGLDRNSKAPLSEHFGLTSSNFTSHRGFIGAPPPAFSKPSQFFFHDGFRSGGSIESLSLQIGGFRFGYCQYDGRFRDNWFFFGNYCYAPTFAGAICSPWYYYYELPPYFCSPTVFIVEDYSYRHYYGRGREYRYRDGYDDRDNDSIDGSIASIVRGFENRDFRDMDSLVPHSGDVAIFMDHQYRYSMRADDYFDMMRDAVENVRTTGYHILDVRTYDDDSVRIEARHETVDPWNRHSNVYNTILLQRESRGYVIREFGTSQHRD